ncbi:anion permease, partial [Staphylococcus sp. GDX8P113P-2]|uniref:anion permease n=1 Tax=Staphylococcus sp. GDX8P113P-2 TaxID=2804110 RepID=UPI001AEC7025
AATKATALIVLSVAGNKTNRIVIGTILVAILDSLFGTGNALKLAFSGFSTSALALVAAALFLATAMQITQLHKRLALIVLSVAGNKTNRIV